MRIPDKENPELQLEVVIFSPVMSRSLGMMYLANNHD